MAFRKQRPEHIQQSKGEAECAQIHWLFDLVKELALGDAVLSVVTSADIDSVIAFVCLITQMAKNAQWVI